MRALVDSHCHLDFPDFADERDAVIARARAAGVGTMLTICTKIREFDRVAGIAQSDSDIWCTVGTHPHEAEGEQETARDALVALGAHPKVVAIGECGLDFYYEESPRPIQEAVFRTHIAAAQAAALPLVVHTRDADDQTAAILGEAASLAELRGVLHCFTSSRALAKFALDLGFYISFSGIVTFKNAVDLRETAKYVPLDRMLVETDAPFLAPVPMRGTRNEPAFVRHTAEFVAGLKGVSIAELAEATTANFFRLFSKAAPSA
jgi:TatD DNase family protein